MISDQVVQLCQEQKTVSSEYAGNPTRAPGEVMKSLFSTHHHWRTEKHFEKIKTSTSTDDAELEKAKACGKWGPTEPSELFLRVFHDVLGTIEDDPLAGMCSPSLLGSYGTLPLTVISTVPDVCRHFGNVIVRAKREIFFATNYWQASPESKYITNALHELNKRCGERNERVNVKILYDRGDVRQITDNHLIVPPSNWTGTAIQFPAKEEIPNLDMEIMNYHTPVLGTFHCKFMVCDGEIAVLCSNNVQSNGNLEMMCQYEGPIVKSFLDMALISWYKELHPPLSGKVSIGKKTEGSANGIGNDSAAANSEDLAENHWKDTKWDDDIGAETRRVQTTLSPSEGKTRLQAVTDHLNHARTINLKGTASESDQDEAMTPYFVHNDPKPCPIAMVCRIPYGYVNNNHVYTPQNVAWLSAINNAQKSVFIQTPTLNATHLLPAITAACERGVQVTCYISIGYNDAGELLPGQGGTNEMIAYKLVHSLSEAAQQNLHYYWYVAKDMNRPINGKLKQRDCHIKLMIVDGHIGIQGNGNQDTQSWCHSQEINVMLDSAEICESWVKQLHSNQNTHIYGKLGPGGIWHDSEGKEVEGSLGTQPGKFSWAKGIVGAVQRLRGTGGF